MHEKLYRYFIIGALASLALFVSCSKSDPAPVQEDFSVLVKIESTISAKPGDEVTFSVYSSKGPKLTDEVVFRDKQTSKETICRISRADDASFSFIISSDLNSGTYTFGIRRNGVTKSLGTVSVTVEKPEPVDPDDPVKPAEGASVYGLVSCNGKPLANVVVTDGYLVTATGSDGVYQLASKKKNGMVYLSTPSGYTAPCIGVQAQFYKYTKFSGATVERVDFELQDDGDQTNHTMMFFGDIHLANRANDRTQFRAFTDEISAYMKAHPSDKIYAMTLGDMTWDVYWYSANYQFENYLEDVNRIQNMTIYHTMGNHDHNMRTDVVGDTAGWAEVDWDTAGRFRGAMGPNYYSFNIGKVHYIVLDDIFCRNTTGGASDDRHYTEELPPDDMNWLKEDLKYVDKSTPIFVTMHATVYNQAGSPILKNAGDLLEAFNGYSSVNFVTGHSHLIYNVDKGSIREFNSGAVCAAWWWAGYFYQSLNVAKDGALGGYRIMDVNGTKTSSYFKCTGRQASYQFRTYDRNCIKIVPADLGVTKEKNIETFNSILNEYGGYNTSSSSNYVYINVWDYGPDWKVSVTENGKSLDVKQLYAYDPLFLIAYTAPRLRSYDTVSWNPQNSVHFFRVTASTATSTLEIKVTDPYGREYTETMNRPKAFLIDTYK